MAPNKSRNRRTRVVPNRSYDHRPSSSMAGTRPSHFFKIILPSTIDDKKLRIPEKFVREFGDELFAVATLTAPNGHFWKVRLEKSDKEIWFHDGWQDFVEYYSIHYGYFLVFRYEGNSIFHVLVFDNTATEIEYPRSKNCKLEDEVDVVGFSDDAKKSRHDKVHENEIFTSDKQSAKHEVYRGRYVSERFSGTSSEGRLMMFSGIERVIQAARMFKPESPSFMAILRQHLIYNPILYVPARFAINYLPKHDQFVKLENTDGQQWYARCYSHGCSRSAKNIGWGRFYRENNLGRGDVCVIELIKWEPVVLKVSIFRMADYGLSSEVASAGTNGIFYSTLNRRKFP